MSATAVVSFPVQDLDSLAARDGKDEQQSSPVEDLPALSGEAAEEDFESTVAQNLAMEIDRISHMQSRPTTGRCRFMIIIGCCSLVYFDGAEELGDLKTRLQRELQSILARNLTERMSPADLADLYIALDPVMVDFTDVRDNTYFREGMTSTWQAAYDKGCYAAAVAVRGHYRDGRSHGHARQALEEMLGEVRELPKWGTTAEFPSWF